MAVAVATVAAYALPLFFTASLALDIERELDLTHAQLGVSITAFWVVATVTTLPAGRLVDRLGAARSVRVAGALVVLGSLGIALAAHSFPAFVALLGVTALGNAIVPPAMSVFVTGELRPRRRGAVFGLQQAGPPLASVAAGLALPTVGAALGWRWVFALGAGAAALATAAVRGERVRGARVPLRPAPVEGPRAFTILLAVGGLLGSAAASGLVAYLVVYASGEGLSPGAAGVLLAGASTICAAARIRLGALADRRDAPLLPQMAWLVLAGTAGFALLAVGLTPTIVVGSLLALGIGWGWPGLYVLSAIEHGGRAPGRAVGAAVTGTFAGAIVGPLLVGLLGTAASFEAAWVACAALSVVAAAAFVGARRVEAKAHAPRLAAGVSATGAR